jgi:hypothetical protein
MRTVRPPVTRLLTKELVGHVGEFSTLTPRPKLTHGYSRRATYALPVLRGWGAHIAGYALAVGGGRSR